MNKGAYSQTAAKDQVASGITNTKWVLECTGQTTQTTNTSDTTITGTFDGITVSDTTAITVKATATYTAGTEVPLSYLSKTEVDGVQTSTKRIAGGSKSSNKGTLKGFRNQYYKVLGASEVIANPENLTAAEIKAKLTAIKTIPNTLTATGMQQMFFAVPKSLGRTGLSIMGANPPAPQTVKGPFTVQIGGVNNYQPVDYDVYYVSNASPTSGSDTYTLTWS